MSERTYEKGEAALTILREKFSVLKELSSTAKAFEDNADFENEAAVLENIERRFELTEMAVQLGEKLKGYKERGEVSSKYLEEAKKLEKECDEMLRGILINNENTIKRLKENMDTYSTELSKLRYGKAAAFAYSQNDTPTRQERYDLRG